MNTSLRLIHVMQPLWSFVIPVLDRYLIKNFLIKLLGDTCLVFSYVRLPQNICLKLSVVPHSDFPVYSSTHGNLPHVSYIRKQLYHVCELMHTQHCPSRTVLKSNVSVKDYMPILIFR